MSQLQDNNRSSDDLYVLHNDFRQRKVFILRSVMLHSLLNVNPCPLCASSAQHISHLLLVLQLALPPHSLALVLDLASALGLQQLAVV